MMCPGRVPSCCLCFVFRLAQVHVVPLMQDFVDLERLPFNRDYKGILGNIMAIRKMKRPRYKTRLNPDIGGSAQKYSMVPGRSSADSRGFLWTSEVDPLEQHPICHLHMWLAVEGIFCYMCVEHAQPAILNDGAGLQGTGSRFAPCLESVGGLSLMLEADLCQHNDALHGVS